MTDAHLDNQLKNRKNQNKLNQYVNSSVIYFFSNVNMHSCKTNIK